MIQRLILLALGIGAGKLLLDIFAAADEEQEDHKHPPINHDFLINQDQEEFGFSVLKGKITRAINSIKKESKKFKIGKTGHPGKRMGSHSGFDEMFLLCSSSDEELINELESYYTAKYIDDPKNENEKVGSAGDAKTKDGQYYLYVIVQS
ncbi:MAG: hypothetical protein ED557_05350 [Balneola sp.]|nr:MAG: hypothetical protein ED557_05350 [Balneola sp.]